MVDRLTVDDMVGAWAIMPTPATEDASDWRTQMTVDLDESVRAVEALIAAGVDGLWTLGTLGEGGALSREEKRAFVGALVETARGRIPIFTGTTALSTRECVEQMREARDIGAAGTMCGPSMWNKPSVDVMVQFYRDIAEAVPELAICIYANPFVFKFGFPPPFWAQVTEIPQVVCAKIPAHGTLLRDLKASKRRIRLMPIDSEYYGAAKLAPDDALAFWTSGSCCGPAPAIALRDFVAQAKVDGDWSRVEALANELDAANLPIVCYGNIDMFQENNVTLEKGRMAAAGWMKPGPNRAPYHVAAPQAIEFAKRGGEAWAAMHKKYEQILARASVNAA